MISSPTTCVQLLVVVFVTLLASCGGGGGGGSSSEPPPSEPITISINSPTAGQLDNPDQLTITGNADNAESVFVAIADGAESMASGVASWTVTLDTAGLSAGTYVITARAVRADVSTSSSLSVAIVRDSDDPPVDDPPLGDTNNRQPFTYFSSVDGASLTGNVYNSAIANTSETAVPLLIFLHGANGTGTIRPSVVQAAAERGWLAIGPDGREWGVTDEGCPWRYSVSYFDSPDPDVGPGEQDILDVIDWARQNYNIDDSRIYLTGFSYGGRGAYILGLKNPGVFAAIGAMAPLTDAFEDIIRLPDPIECKGPITGGLPGDSDRVNASFKATSARFLIENAYNESVYHAHGSNDRITRNIVDTDGFQHGFDLLIDNSFSGCHGASDLCFEHTPTLTELSDAFPDGYDWAYMITDNEHLLDDRWIEGVENDDTNLGVVGVQPGRLISLIDFLESKSLGDTPQTVVFKTYEDQHQRAYWLELVSAVPWSQLPAMVKATRDVDANSVAAEISRASSLAIDLDEASLSLASPLEIRLIELIEPVFDPETVMTEGETQSTSIQLRSSSVNGGTYSVTLNGQSLASDFIDVAPGAITIGPILVDSEVLVEVR